MNFTDRYRPRRFADFVGQASALTRVTSMVRENSPKHLLIHGPAGTGKTSLARAYAAAFLCHADGEQVPCWHCSGCNSSQCFIQLETVNAEIAREIADRLEPAISCTFQFYFFDEAQRMHRQAFDELLQSMERPNSRVFFIFSTTNLQAIPETVRQRCNVLATSLLSVEDLEALAKSICEEEGVALDRAALDLLIGLSGGSARSLVDSLDQVKTEQIVRRDEVAKFYGIHWLQAIPEYLLAVVHGLGPLEEDRILQSWPVDCNVKQDQIFGALAHLFATRVQGLTREGSIFNSFETAHVDEIVAAIALRARAQRKDLQAFWEELIDHWRPQHIGINQAHFDLYVNTFRRLLNKAVPTPAQIRRWTSPRPEPKRVNREPVVGLSIKFLAPGWIAKVQHAGAFSLEELGAPFDTSISIRWSRAGIDTEARITELVGELLRQLCRRRERCSGQPCTYIYIHEKHPVHGFLTTIIMHSGAAERHEITPWLNKFWAGRIERGAARFFYVTTYKSATETMTKRRHRRLLFRILGCGDPSSMVGPGGPKLLDQLKVPARCRRPRGNLSFPKPLVISHNIDSKAQSAWAAANCAKPSPRRVRNRVRNSIRSED